MTIGAVFRRVEGWTSHFQVRALIIIVEFERAGLWLT